MKTIITYQEVNELISDSFNQPLVLSHYDETSVCLSYSVVGINIKCSITVENISDNVITFSYHFGSRDENLSLVEKLKIKAVNAIADKIMKKIPKLQGINIESDNKIVACLNSIPKLEPILKYGDITDLQFDNEGIILYVKITHISIKH